MNRSNATPAPDEITGTWRIHRDGRRKRVSPIWQRLKEWVGILGTAVGIVAALAGGGWWLVQKVVVTQSDWAVARVQDAGFQARVTEALRSISERLDRIERRSAP